MAVKLRSLTKHFHRLAGKLSGPLPPLQLCFALHCLIGLLFWLLFHYNFVAYVDLEKMFVFPNLILCFHVSFSFTTHGILLSDVQALPQFLFLRKHLLKLQCPYWKYFKAVKLHEHLLPCTPIQHSTFYSMYFIRPLSVFYLKTPIHKPRKACLMNVLIHLPFGQWVIDF